MDKETEIKLIRRIRLWKHSPILVIRPAIVCVLLCLEIQDLSPEEMSPFLECGSNSKLRCGATNYLLENEYISEKIVNEVKVKKRFSINPKGKAFLEKAKLLEPDLLEAREKMFQKNKNG